MKFLFFLWVIILHSTVECNPSLAEDIQRQERDRLQVWDNSQQAKSEITTSSENPTNPTKKTIMTKLAETWSAFKNKIKSNFKIETEEDLVMTVYETGMNTLINKYYPNISKEERYQIISDAKKNSWLPQFGGKKVEDGVTTAKVVNGMWDWLHFAFIFGFVVVIMFSIYALIKCYLERKQIRRDTNWSGHTTFCCCIKC